MKRVLPLFLMLVATPIAQAAPTPKTTSKVQIDPAAIELMDKAIAAYKTGNGLVIKFDSSLYVGKRIMKSGGTLRWKAPNLLRLEKAEGDDASLMISDGQTLFMSFDPQNFLRFPLEKNGAEFVANVAASQEFGVVLAPLLTGKNPLPLMQKAAASFKGRSYRFSVVRLPVTLVEDVASDGLRLTTRLLMDKKPVVSETTGWFDAKSHWLRRVQTITQLPNARVVAITNISQTDLNPTFAPETFVWSPPPGAKEQKEDEKQVYFDPKLKVGTVPHPLTGTALDGKPRPIANYRGKVLLLDFWATWCGPCIEEIPNVLSNYRKYHLRGFDVLGISLDEDKAALNAFVKARKLTWPQLFDGRGWKTENATRYGVQAIPFTLLIGRDGKIAAVNPRGPQLEREIQKALKK